MKKIKVAIIAIIDGLILVTAMTAVFLGIIYTTTISAEYFLLMLAPAPAVWLHTKLYKLCERLNDTQD